MTRFEASESIERPAEEVFSFLADLGNEPGWQLLSGEPGRPGATYRRTGTRHRHEEVEYRLAEVEHPRLLRYERLTGKGETDRTFLVREEGAATRLTLVQEYRATGPLDRLVSKVVLRPNMGRLACEGELARIKSALEA